MIAFARYDRNQAWDSFQRMTRARIAGGSLTEQQAEELIRQYESDINRYTYLE
jgi:arginine decarboxylase-like protein